MLLLREGPHGVGVPSGRGAPYDARGGREARRRGVGDRWTVVVGVVEGGGVERGNCCSGKGLGEGDEGGGRRSVAEWWVARYGWSVCSRDETERVGLGFVW